MYHVYCCIQGDLGYTPPDTPIPVRGPLTEEEEDVSIHEAQCNLYLHCAHYFPNMQTFTTCPQESPLTGIHVHVDRTE